ncbi:MAG: MiaB/RimO family radical SAM methylthiotransferase [Chloroflexota bacterium]
MLEAAGLLQRPGAAEAFSSYGGRTRSFIKVQEGCRNGCAYCIVPLVRGDEKSVPVEQVIDEVRRQVDGGTKEVVLTGTRVGAYDGGGVDLVGLLGCILAETGIARLRLSSLQPYEVSSGLLRLWSDGRLCPHFHLSLQSGSGSVLRRMKRRYSASDYREAVALIREAVPDAAITTDVITGFPGETEAEFQASYDFCRELEFARIHVFPYSLRQGTEAAALAEQVVDEAKRQRAQRMLALSRESARSFRSRFLGRTLPVLWEQSSGGTWSGLTSNYIRVYAAGDEDLTNELLPVRLVRATEDGVWGEVL